MTTCCEKCSGFLDKSHAYLPPCANVMDCECHSPTQKNSLIARIEGMKNEALRSKHEDQGDPCWLCKYDLGRQDALDDVLKIVRELAP